MSFPWESFSELGTIAPKSIQSHRFTMLLLAFTHAILCDNQGNIWVNDENNKIVKYQLKNGMYIPHKITLQGLDKKIDITSVWTYIALIIHKHTCLCIENRKKVRENKKADSS